MTTFRLVQRGTVPSSPLVVCFLVGSQCDADLRAALPGVAIVCTDEAPLAPNHTDIELARKCALAALEAPLALVGFSAGCQPVRALRILGIPAVAYVTIDGTAAALPPLPWQIKVWSDLAIDARAGRALWVATCLQQSYVEHLPAGQAFSWDRHVLEAALGVELPVGAEVHEAGLHVYSLPSASIDKDAHIRQQRETMPHLCRERLAPWLTQASPSTADTDPAPPILPPPATPSQGGNVLEQSPLGERALAIAIDALASGVHEQPPGSNAGPEVSAYLKACGMGPGAPWCAAFASWCDRAANDNVPGPWGMQPSVAGLWRVATASGHARPPETHPELGWLAIFARTPGQDPRTGGQGHVGRVESCDGASFSCIEGNCHDRVSREAHPLADAIGWIAYEPVAHDDSTAARLWALADALDAGDAEGTALDKIEKAA